MIRYWVEVMTVTRFNEWEAPEPEGWDDMTEEEREAYCAGQLDQTMANYVGTGFEY